LGRGGGEGEAASDEGKKAEKQLSSIPSIEQKVLLSEQREEGGIFMTQGKKGGIWRGEGMEKKVIPASSNREGIVAKGKGRLPERGNSAKVIFLREETLLRQEKPWGGGKKQGEGKDSVHDGETARA